MRAATLVNMVYSHAVKVMQNDNDMDYKDVSSHLEEVLSYALYEIECISDKIVLPARNWPSGYCCPRAFLGFDFSKFWEDVETVIHRATTRKQRKQLKMQWRKRGI